MKPEVIAVAAVAVLAFIMWKKRKAAKSGFLAAIRYRPAFIDPLGTGRETTRGYTTGVMPSIETDEEGGWLCPGLLGVPP
jgi:hypothetical protein